MRRLSVCLLFLGMAVQIVHGGSLRTVPGTDATIADAIAAASSGDTIMIGAGTFQEQLVIDKDLTLIGAGIERTILHLPPEFAAALGGQ